MQLEDKSKLVYRNEESLKMTDDAIKSRDALLGELQQKAEKLERKLRESCKETTKGNEIIESLKSDVVKGYADLEEERKHKTEERRDKATGGTSDRDKQQAG